MKLAKLFILLMCIPSFSGFTQKDLVQYFPAGEQSASILIESYLTPMAQAYGGTLSNGWVTTAKSHRILGVDITGTANYFFTPNRFETYDYSKLGLTDVTLLGAEDDKVPTVYSDAAVRPLEINNESGNNGEQFVTPSGRKLGETIPLISAVMIPALQLGLGLPRNTELKIRYTPEVTIDGSAFKTWGLGIVHDIKQYIPVIAPMPFDLSALVGYTNLEATHILEPLYPGEDQTGEYHGRSVTLQMMAGKSVPIVSGYVTLGYNYYISKYNVTGSYTINDLPEPIELTDPVSLEYNAGGIRAGIGGRIRMGPIAFNGEYTIYSKGSILTLGFGLVFRD